MDIKEKIVLGVFRCICKECSNEFDHYDLPDFLYGVRLIRTEDGKDFALVKCIEDKVFQEVSEISDEFFEKTGLPETVRHDYFDKVFGLSCDHLNGKALDASVGVICQNCRSKEVDRFEYNPRKKIEMDVNLVSHDRWERMTEKEKRHLIFSALHDLYKRKGIKNAHPPTH